MAGWCGDLGRLYWGLLYWNGRKALFRLRGARGAAPCQHPSDSGAAGQTGCEACREWRNKRSFRRLCPLLTVHPDGRHVCSVAAADVRPFWGRAAAIYGGSAGAAALLALLSVFATFRIIGYRVPLHVIAWPPAWHRIQQARADYFYRLALHATAEGDVRKSFLALTQVYVLDPDNAEAARLLAQLTQISNPDYSDAIFSRLALGRRADSEDAAQAWFRALMARGDFISVGGLSARMLRDGARQTSAWTQALLFAESMTGKPGNVDDLLAGSSRISAETRSVLSLAKSLRVGDAHEKMKVLRLYIGGATTAFEVYYSLGRMIDLGAAGDVVSILERSEAPSLDPYDREVLKLNAYAAEGWRVLVSKEVGRLLENGASGPAVVLICGHLIRRPDDELARLVFHLLDVKPLPQTADMSGVHMALLCMAGVNGLSDRTKQESRLESTVVGRSFPALARVREFFESATPAKNPVFILPVLNQLPLEITYALYAHYGTAVNARAGASP